VVFCIFFQLFFDLFNDALNKGLLDLISNVDLFRAKDSLNVFPLFFPFTLLFLIIRVVSLEGEISLDLFPDGIIILVLLCITTLDLDVLALIFLKHPREEIVLILYSNGASDKAKVFILKNVQEDVRIIELLKTLVDAFHSIAWVEDIQFLFSFSSWLRKNDSFFLDILFEAPSDIRLAPKFHSCEHTHLLDDIDGLLASIL